MARREYVRRGFLSGSSAGNLTNLQDANSNDTSWVYDGLGRVTQETNELSNSRYFVYDAASNLIRKTDRNNRVTRYEYDNLDRLTSELWISGGTATPTITGATSTPGGPISEVQRVGFDGGAMSLTGGTFTLTYDGQTTSAIAYNATAATVKAALEALSNIDPDEVAVTKITDTSFKQEWRLTFQNDLGGTNVVQTTVNATSVTGGMPPLTEIEATDTSGGTNSEVQTITLNNSPTGGTFRLTFGSEQTADIAYNASAATVDSALETLPTIDTVTVSGSAGGPYTITFTGSHANTNVVQLYGDATYLTKGSLDRTIAFEYDVASQLTEVDDPAAEYDYTYDYLGRLTAELQDITGLTPDIEFAQTWNANSRRLSLAAEIGGTADFSNTYAYDNLSRMTQVSQQDVGGGNVVRDKRVDFAYNALGQYTSLTRYQSTGTGTPVATSTYTYDTLNRLTALDHKQSTTDLALYDYTYDFMDRIASMTHNVDGASTFTYDKESEVTAADHNSPRSDESFTFDAAGNRTGGSYTVTTNNRTTTDATYSYTYDSEGNRATRTKTSNDYVTEYSWDHRNRLVGVTEKDDMANVLSTVEYSYDAFNRLVHRVHDADGPGGNDPTDQFFAYDGGSVNPVLDFDGDTASDLTHRNLWAEAVDQILATEDVTSLASAGNVEWPLPDHQGTIRDVADVNEGTGTTSVTNHLTFDAFGILTAETNGSVEFAFGFMAKPLDEATGLIYYVNRWYDPNLGKWTSHDPIEFVAGDTNLARIVGNSVSNATDPLGLIIKINADDAAITDLLATYGISGQTTSGGVIKPANDGTIGYAPDNVKAAILASMITATTEFKVAGEAEAAIKNLELQMEIRANIIELANSKEFDFGKIKTNAKYFDEFGNLKPGINPYTAFLDPWEHPELYSYGCKAASIVVLIAATAKALGETEFNKMYKAEQMKMLMSPPEVTGSVYTTKPTNPEAAIAIGDVGYIKNNDPTDDGYLKGENVIMVGMDKFWGHLDILLAVMNKKDWESEVAKFIPTGMEKPTWDMLLIHPAPGLERPPVNP